MKRQVLSVLLFALFFSNINASDNKHFITDKDYRDKVNVAFKQKMELIGKHFYNIPNKNISSDEEEALKFLYAYMPLADATDYPTTFFLDNIRSSFKAKNEMAWGNKVPELLFRHFVIPIRVNNENLDNSRMIFYDELKSRVKGKSMYDAILEVNHWCHEKVTYEPSDARTSSPLQTIRTAKGRCGEESTFTVAALRSIGIPARQVYTPRWAHTDDNHAWVEAWADGKWYFLGACEPEAVLNLAWFNAPASRAMLMHTRVFGDYYGPEEVMLRTPNHTEINLIDNYGSTARVDFNVTDEKGTPIDNARVDFKIYNYSEFYTAVIKYTDKNGKTFLSAGKGDMIVWASKNGNYGFRKVSFGKDKQVTITLNRSKEKDEMQLAHNVDSFDIVPPAEHVILPETTKEQHDNNLKRFAGEDSIRNAYTATFMNKETATDFARTNGLPEEDVVNILVKSRGNHKTIKQFILNHKDNIKRAIDLLNTLSDKDLRDMQEDILEDNFGANSDQLCPRVENEMIITPFKKFFENAFDKKTSDSFRNNPALLVNWVKKNIRLYSVRNAATIAQTPIGVWKSRISDARSRDIFFVDVARSLGIEAQKDVVTSKIQYKKAGKWIDVNFNEEKQVSTPTGKLVLNFVPTKTIDNPKYYSHFTLARISNGTSRLLNFDEGQVDMGGGVSWANTFKNGMSLDEGTYELVTGTRLASGSVLATSQIFNIKAGGTTTLDLNMRTSDTEVSVIGNFDSESKYTRLPDMKEVSLLSQTGRGYFIVGLIGMGQEPTNHALRDIAKVKSAFDKWKRPIVLLFEDEASAAKFKEEDFGKLPDTVIYGIDKDGSIKKQICAQMKLKTDKLLPIFIISDTFNRVVYVSQGYTIGLGEQMDGTIKKL